MQTKAAEVSFGSALESVKMSNYAMFNKKQHTYLKYVQPQNLAVQ
jgi:hypothetical protein